MGKLQPYALNVKGMKQLQPATPGMRAKQAATNRSHTHSKKKSKSKKSKRTLEQYEGDQQQEDMQQQQVMPVLNEEFLNQLTEEQLQELLMHQ